MGPSTWTPSVKGLYRRGKGKTYGSLGEKGKSKGKQEGKSADRRGEREPLLHSNKKRKGPLGSGEDRNASPESETGVQKLEKRKIEITERLKKIETDRSKPAQQAQELKRELHLAKHQLLKYTQNTTK